MSQNQGNGDQNGGQNDDREVVSVIRNRPVFGADVNTVVRIEHLDALEAQTGGLLKQNRALQEQNSDFRKRIRKLEDDVQKAMLYSLYGTPGLFDAPIDMNGNPLNIEPAAVDRYLVVHFPDGNIRIIPCHLPDVPDSVLRIGKEGVFTFEVRHLRATEGEQPEYMIAIKAPGHPTKSESIYVDELRYALEGRVLQIGVGTPFCISIWSYALLHDANYQFNKLISAARKAANEALRREKREPSMQQLEAPSTTASAQLPASASTTVQARPSSRPPATPAVALNGQPRAKTAGASDADSVPVDLNLTAAAVRVETGPHQTATG